MNPLYVAIGIIALAQVGSLAIEQRDRREKSTRARIYADEVGKPLLVVGAPYGGSPLARVLKVGTHECGDVCLDIQGCPECPYSVVSDVRDIPFPDGYFGAALASHVLEHLPTVEDAEMAYRELSRVADRVFVASPLRTNIYAWLKTDHHLWVQEEPQGIYFQQR